VGLGEGGKPIPYGCLNADGSHGIHHGKVYATHVYEQGP
jgi:hypothetical protein